MSSYLRDHSTRATPQTEPLRGQVENSAGGHSWQAGDWERLQRFLVLGSEGGSYYAGERELTAENATVVRRCLAADGLRTVRTIVEVSDAGRAPKNDPAIFALAICAAAEDPTTKWAALDALPKVCRIGTHLLHFAAFVEQFRGHGRSLNRALGAWYLEREPGELAYQLVKYRQRDGWTHADVLRLAKPRGRDHSAATQACLAFAVGKGVPEIEVYPELRAIEGYQRAQAANTSRETAALVREYEGRLPREALNPDHLTDAQVWHALLDVGMPTTALLRNLPTMTRLGVIGPLSDRVGKVAEQLVDAEKLIAARVHPLQVLVALRTYQSGHSVRGSAMWQPVAQIVDALDAAFYAAFKAVEPTGKRTLLGLDVSGSMGWPEIAGMPGITPHVGSAAMALVTAATEPQHAFMAFSHQFVPLTISPRQRLDDVMRTMSGLPFGRTDCSLPMLWALENRAEVDTFVIYTDSETYASRMHPSQALIAYREKTGIPAKLVVVGMVANRFTIADPADPGMLDVVGFDTSAPGVIAEFSRG